MIIPATVYTATDAALADLLEQAEATGNDELAAACEEEIDLRDLAASDPAEIGARQAAQDACAPLAPAWWEYR